MDEKFWFARKVIVDYVIQQRDVDPASLATKIKSINLTIGIEEEE